MREDFEMSEEDLKILLSSMTPHPMIMLQCGPTESLQERANKAWAWLGEKMGFKPMTVRPNGRGQRHFSAEKV